MSYIKTPCKSCPFRIDVEPFLSPEVGLDIAYLSQNEFNEFYCHYTYDHDDNGDAIIDRTQSLCAGFLTLVSNQDGNTPDGFIPSQDICYEDSFEMSQVYQNPEEFYPIER